MTKKKVVEMKKPTKTVLCPNCGMVEREEGEPVYACVECGKQGFDCCVAGTNTICNECEEREKNEGE